MNISTQAFRTFGVGLLLAILIPLTGCKAPTYHAIPPDAVKADESIQLRAGDTVKLTFPGAVTLNATQTVRRDGKIALSLKGEMYVAGMTPADLEKELVSLEEEIASGIPRHDWEKLQAASNRKQEVETQLLELMTQLDELEGTPDD